MKVNTILELIGNTPHIRLSKMFQQHQVWMKLESNNPGGSIKDRIALAMVEDAEKKNILKPGGTVIEPTSGNTGIGLSMAGAIKGYRVVLVMPESMSMERRKILKAYGAELVLTPREKGMNGAIEEALRIKENTPGAFMPQQFENAANPRIHVETTAEEILNDFPYGFDYMITGIGTGGHISGVGATLKEHFSEMQVYGVEPADSPVLNAGKPGPHPIQGIGAGFIPKTLSVDVLDEVITVEAPEAFEMARKLAVTEGILAGVSTGASMAAIQQKAAGIPPGSRILTFAYDTGERYLSLDQFI